MILIDESRLLILNNSLVEGNVTDYEGGGLYGTTMTIRNSSISNNEAQTGGGIRSWYTVQIHNSAINNNTATYGNGGGIYSGGDLVLVNSTISNNIAQNETNVSLGGGIYRASGFIRASNVTISGNSAETGGGIMNQSAPVTLRNTLIVGNQAATGLDCTGTITTNGYNLISDTTGCSFSPTIGDLTNIDARIANWYGWPAAMALWVDSPAIDAGNPGGCLDHLGNPINFDQIGNDRPSDGNRDGDNFCDIGAYEYDPDHAPQWVFLPLILK